MPSEAAIALASGAEAEYWDGLLAGELRLQRCAACKSWHWPAVFRCAGCGSWDHVWEPVSLAGKVYSWTRSWHPFGGLEAIDKPFVIAVVQLDTGGQARLVGIMDDPGEVHIGLPVTGTITTTAFAGEDVPAIRWSA
jgi:uncharacterized OB-fold protein